MEIASRKLNTWSKTFCKSLSSTLTAHSHEEWYQEVQRIAQTWHSAQDANYISADRWNDFYKLGPKSPYLCYLVGEKNESQISLRNLFDLLDADFHDQRNPIGALITGFVSMYMQEFSQSLEETITSSNSAKALDLLFPLSNTVLRYCAVLAVTTISFYAHISLLLSLRKRDLEDLLLSHIMKGKLFRLAEGLAIVGKAEESDRLRKLSRENPTRRQLAISSELTNPAIDVATQEICSYLSSLSSTENLHARRHCLQQLTEKLSETTDSIAIRANILTLASIRAKADYLPAQLYTAKTFLIDCPEGIDAVLSVIEALTNNRGDCAGG